jgi:predicted lipid-binding transport protein (Tim44 family)
MKRLFLLVCALIIGGAMLVTDAEARKLGGGRSIGAQRSAPPASAPAKPGPQQAQPGSQPSGQQAAPAQPAPSGFSRWLPMLGGLAIGGLLGSMLGGFGGFGGILLIALLAIGAVLVFKAFARRREEAAPSRPVQLAGMGSEKVSMPAQHQASGTQRAGVELDTRSAKPNIPAGFDTASFLRGAKMNFVKLQAANDLGNLDEIREFTTAEMFSELNKDVQERASAPQHTDVVGLEADLLEIATESGKHWASVRFSGTVRESREGAPVGFEEVWNLVKPADGSSGWLLAGIQQMH